MKRLCVLAVTIVFAAVAAHAAENAVQTSVRARQLYDRHCARCHEGGIERVPDRASLGRLGASFILRALVSGKMSAQGAVLAVSDRELLAKYLSGGQDIGDHSGVTAAKRADGFCRQTEWAAVGAAPSSWNGWSPEPSNRRFQRFSGLPEGKISRLKLKWAFGFDKDRKASTQPTIVAGRLFIGTAGGVVYALDARTGCVEWKFTAGSEVRGALSVTEGSSSRSAGGRVYFGDVHANVYALNARTGRLVWKKKVDGHPAARITGSLRLNDGRLYVPISSMEEILAQNPAYECCTFRGSLVALRAEDGERVWKTYTISQSPKPLGRNARGARRWGPSGAAIWSAPTVDAGRGVLYVATGNGYSDPDTSGSDAVLAMSMQTGKVLWDRQVTPGDEFNASCLRPDGQNCPANRGSDYDFGSSPILVRIGDRRLLVAGQKSGVVTALDPDKDGRIVWQRRIGKGGMLGGIQWGPAADDRKLYAALSDAGYRRGAAKGRSLDPRQGGGLFALDLASGTVVWAAAPSSCGARTPCSPAQSAAVTVIPGAVFSGSMDGHMRAYSSRDGHVLWDFDSERSFETVNGVPATGGSIDASGAAVAEGMMFFESGYFLWGGAPGNVLLGFSIDAK